MTNSNKLQQNELSKCELLCANCHAEEEANRSIEKYSTSSTAVKQREKRNTRKQRLVDLLGGECQKCHYKNNISSLQFHHRDPATKIFLLSKGSFNRKWGALLEEVSKCDLLCANCHAEAHHDINS